MTPRKIEHSKRFLSYLVDIADDRFLYFGGTNLQEYRARCTSCWAGLSVHLASGGDIGEYLSSSIDSLLEMFPFANRSHIRKCFTSLKAREKKDATTIAVSRSSAREILSLRDHYSWASVADIVDVMLSVVSKDKFLEVRTLLDSVAATRASHGTNKEAKR